MKKDAKDNFVQKPEQEIKIDSSHEKIPTDWWSEMCKTYGAKNYWAIKKKKKANSNDAKIRIEK